MIGLTVAAVSAAAVAAVAALGRPTALPVVALIVLAMAWGALPQAIDALLGRPYQESGGRGGPTAPDSGAGTPYPTATGRDRSPRPLTLVVRLGGEPAEVAAASV